ncbi:hypothetical protein ALC60_02406 [Trachymyrmex zeteki]|uniref:Uncharacterized protein n=1 Tax=Mycetomoellerius zeteki TaxID=64791 RepID=A0A151XEQ9_9HYME|nr:hypothetical protein ALC60_02406 [Trachymyrmex zeteki]
MKKRKLNASRHGDIVRTQNGNYSSINAFHFTKLTITSQQISVSLNYLDIKKSCNSSVICITSDRKGFVKTFIGQAREDGRGSFSEKRRKNSRIRFGSSALQNILSRNCPAGVTSSESISHAFNIARTTTEKCRQAVLSEGCYERRGKG